MKRNYILSILIFCLPCVGQAQELTGIWRGHFRNNDQNEHFPGADDRYRIEVQLAQNGPKFEAITYSYKTTIFYGKADADGSFNKMTQKVLLREKKITEVKMLGGDACIMTCFLKYSKLNDEEFLEGTYTSMNVRDSSDCGKGVIFLHKVPESDFYKEPFVEKKEEELAAKKKNSLHSEVPAPKKKPDSVISLVKKAPVIKKPATKPMVTHNPAAPNTTAKTNIKNHADSVHARMPLAKTSVSPVKKKAIPEKGNELARKNPNMHKLESLPPDTTGKQPGKLIMPDILPVELKTRSNEIVKTIIVNTRDVELNIYDDGAIDNDSVTVYYDHKRIVSHARLTDQAIVVRLHLEENADTHEVVMVADNLGDIPPNTSLMVVKAGDKRFEVRIVSTEQKNAVVLFRYQKPE